MAFVFLLFRSLFREVLLIRCLHLYIIVLLAKSLSSMVCRYCKLWPSKNKPTKKPPTIVPANYFGKAITPVMPWKSRVTLRWGDMASWASYKNIWLTFFKPYGPLSNSHWTQFRHPRSLTDTRRHYKTSVIRTFSWNWSWWSSLLPALSQSTKAYWQVQTKAMSITFVLWDCGLNWRDLVLNRF